MNVLASSLALGDHWPITNIRPQTLNGNSSVAEHCTRENACRGGMGRGGEGERVERIQPFLNDFKEDNLRTREISLMDLRRSICLKALMKTPLAISLIPDSVRF